MKRDRSSRRASKASFLLRKCCRSRPYRSGWLRRARIEARPYPRWCEEGRPGEDTARVDLSLAEGRGVVGFMSPLRKPKFGSPLCAPADRSNVTRGTDRSRGGFEYRRHHVRTVSCRRRRRTLVARFGCRRAQAARPTRPEEKGRPSATGKQGRDGGEARRLADRRGICMTCEGADPSWRRTQGRGQLDQRPSRVVGGQARPTNRAFRGSRSRTARGFYEWTARGVEQARVFISPQGR